MISDRRVIFMSTIFKLSKVHKETVNGHSRVLTKLKFACCMYIILTPRRVASFFERFCLFTHTILYRYPPYQPLSTGSGSILGAGASRPSPGISIGRTAIVVVRTPCIWSYVSSCLTDETSVSEIEPETCSQSFGHHNEALALSFWTYSLRWVPNHHEPKKHLEKTHWCSPGSNPGRLISSLTLDPLCHRAQMEFVCYLFNIVSLLLNWSLALTWFFKLCKHQYHVTQVNLYHSIRKLENHQSITFVCHRSRNCYDVYEYM